MVRSTGRFVVGRRIVLMVEYANYSNLTHHLSPLYTIEAQSSAKDLGRSRNQVMWHTVMLRKVGFSWSRGSRYSKHDHDHT